MRSNVYFPYIFRKKFSIGSNFMTNNSWLSLWKIFAEYVLKMYWKIHWKWDPENILKLPVKNWYSVHEHMVNVLNFTENAQKMHRKQPEFPENILNLVQNSHRNYTEIILKLYWNWYWNISLGCNFYVPKFMQVYGTQHKFTSL